MTIVEFTYLSLGGLLDIPKKGIKIPSLGMPLIHMLVSSVKTSSSASETSRSSSLADALFTSTQQRVLGALFGQPDRSFFVTQIMELAKSGRGAVQRELERLRNGGLVTVHKVATQKHYQANAASPLFDELCGIIQKTVGLAGPIREALESLPEMPRLALIYGSVARRTDTSSSDIDLLVVSDNAELEQVYAALMPVERVLARPISLMLYTEVGFQERLDNENPFISRILSSPTINLIGSVDAE